jgi:sulfur-oxidizing protein SoxZ
MATSRIVMPSSAKKGQIVQIKTLIQHAMETGHRRDTEGAVIRRDLINRFVVTAGGVEIFRADLYPGIAANPYLAFSMRAQESGDVVFEWTGDSNFYAREIRKLTVT